MDLTELMLRKFFEGDDDSAEFSAHLAQQAGNSLSEIYESLRARIYRAGLPSDVGPAMALARLDERLARLATRLSTAANGRTEPQALILCTLHRGVGACISHIYNDMGIPAACVDMTLLAHLRRQGSAMAYQFPRIRYAVLEATHCGPQELAQHLGLLQDLGMTSGRFTVTVFTDEEGGFEKLGFHTLAHFSLADNIPDLFAAAGLSAVNPLTVREQDILRLVANGATNQQAARALGISIATVKTYLERAQAKLKSCDRASAVATALRRSWI